MRKRIKRGTLVAYKEDERWYVILDGVLPGVQPAASYPAGSPVQDAVQDDQPPFEAAYQVTPVAIEQAVARTSAQYMGDLRTMLAEVGKVYEGQLAAKDQALSMQTAALVAKDETIAALRRRAEVAEAALSERSDKPAQAAHAGPGASEAPAAAQGAAPRIAGRVRRWWSDR